MKLTLRLTLTTIACATLACAAHAQSLHAHEADGELEWLFQIADAKSTAASTTAERMGAWGYDMTGQDPRVRPGDDFFKWSNGAWLDRTDIPADRTRYGTFDALRALSEARVHDIVQSLSKDKKATPETRKIAAAWSSFMDEASVEKLDAKPLAKGLQIIRNTRSHTDMARLMGQANASGMRSLFDMGIRDDAKAPENNAIYLSTGGLGLPDRDYYLEDRFADKRVAYEKYIAQLLGMAGWAQPENAANAVLTLETQIAKASWTRTQRRDRDKTYNPMSAAELKAFAPAMPWDAFFEAAKLGQPERMILTTNTAFPLVADIYQATPVETLQAWQAFHMTHLAAPLLSKRFTDAHFQFNSVTLAGQPQERPRWKRGVDFVNGALGESVGKIYVQRYFPAESKEMMATLVTNIRKAMQVRIDQLDWMGAETKVQAQEKLAKFGVKIGYPSTWRDYSALDLKADDLYGNSQRSRAFEWQRQLARVGKKVDKTEWGMTPQTVNAYYSPQRNEIVFPAAILQPPFFDPAADPAINYGGIGGVIGHEISHGFDDQGRKSDGDGVLRNWWTLEDASKFQVQADRLGKQYSAFEPVPGSRVNGQLTMGENIGDLGGMNVTLAAYQISLNGKPAAKIDGTTGEQRVFLGWSQVWRAKYRDEAMRQQLVSDPHSPPYYRVNGIVRNMDAWYQAFDVKPEDKLYVAPADRVRIW
jgi:putative endopeptidase